MINKLYKLKQTQLNQQFVIKKQIQSKLKNIEETILDTQHKIISTSVEKFGAIGDFKILAIHKNSMKYKKEALEEEKRVLLNELQRYDTIIIEYQKDVEKYNYILKENLKIKIKEEQKTEEMVANEYVQSKYIRKMSQNV